MTIVGTKLQWWLQSSYKISAILHQTQQCYFALKKKYKHKVMQINSNYIYFYKVLLYIGFTFVFMGPNFKYMMWIDNLIPLYWFLYQDLDQIREGFWRVGLDMTMLLSHNRTQTKILFTQRFLLRSYKQRIYIFIISVSVSIAMMKCMQQMAIAYGRH